MAVARLSAIENSEERPAFKLEIAHVLFMDVVGYSNLPVNEQQQVVQQLNELVRATAQYQQSKIAGKLISIPAGDGMALVFFESPEEPARCGVEIAQRLRQRPALRLRMGIHSGPVTQIKDVNQQNNVAGAGINIAERVMSCGDAEHILVTSRVAEDLGHAMEWQPHLHPLGDVEVKHGVKIGVVNLCSDAFGNPQLPNKIKQARQQRIESSGGIFGRLFSKRRPSHSSGRKLEEYDFYPFVINRNNVPEFSLKDFRLGMHYFLKNDDFRAARQLIFIGEQNNVRAQLESSERKEYEKLFERYRGREIADDTAEFLENYARLVRLIGRSFPDTGIEILLHNLADPAHSLSVLENNVTGRSLGAGATNLLIDLKRRQLFEEDKLNYELNIGSRKFKCTTIPIVRPEFGVVGAICINIDANYLTDEVVKNQELVEEWFGNFLRTDMQLDENILSKDEFDKAQKGKRHFKDENV